MWNSDVWSGVGTTSFIVWLQNFRKKFCLKSFQHLQQKWTDEHAVIQGSQPLMEIRKSWDPSRKNKSSERRSQAYRSCLHNLELAEEPWSVMGSAGRPGEDLPPGSPAAWYWVASTHQVPRTMLGHPDISSPSPGHPGPQSYAFNIRQWKKGAHYATEPSQGENAK